MTFERLGETIGSIDGVVEARSRFADRPAWWSDGREIAHFDQEGVVDIRLTAPVIRKRRAELAEHAEIAFRASTGADWLEVTVSDPASERLAVQLVRDAVEANRMGPRARK